jgi:hypothetical protein
MLIKSGQHLRQHSVAYLALFVALGGTSFAAANALVPKNSVGTAQVINGSLLKKDFRAGQLPRGARGARGPAGGRGATGAQGLVGPAGPAGVQGPPGTKVSGWELVLGGDMSDTVPPGQEVEIDALCTPGKKPLGGGPVTNFGQGSDLVVVDSYPIQTMPNDTSWGWAVTMANEGTTAQHFSVFATCASMG